MACTDGSFLRLGMDLGTGYIRVNGQHVLAGGTSKDAKSRPLSFKRKQGSDPAIKQIAFYDEDGTVTYGAPDIKKLIDEDPSNHELQYKITELWKLALHPAFNDLDEVKHVKDVLHTKGDRAALQDFMTDHLRGILEDVRELYKRATFNEGRDDAYWRTIPFELEISVPAMWRDEDRDVIFNAAMLAQDSALRVELRPEPLCVGTTYMLDLIESGNIVEEQCLLLVDCGKGTLDIATIKLIARPSDG